MINYAIDLKQSYTCGNINEPLLCRWFDEIMVIGTIMYSIKYDKFYIAPNYYKQKYVFKLFF